MTTMSRQDWLVIADHFDELVSLGIQQRQMCLAGLGLSAQQHQALERLLDAHDAADPGVLERTIDDLVDWIDGTPSNPAPQDRREHQGRRLGAWRVLEEIGRGGMGVVYRGERADGQFERTVAIKVLSATPMVDGRRRDLQSEIRMLARLDHPGIARLLDGGVDDDGVAYLVMEHVDGQPITQYCRTHGLDLRRRIGLIVDVANATAHSHRQLIVHCDIKPGNVLVTAGGQIKLVDFGIAARLPAHPGEIAAQSRRCSPGYAAPEQLMGASPTVGTDVFALGVVMFELLTEQRYRDSLEAASIRLGGASRRDRFAGPSACRPFARIDVDLDAICMRALSHDPEQRYLDADALARDLMCWLEGRPVSAVRGRRLHRLHLWLKRNRLVAASGVAVMAAVVAGASISLWQAAQARTSAQYAQRETERARDALVEAEDALVRANAVSGFLQDLFRSRRPNKPNDQMPTTEELLDSAAARVLGSNTVGRVERFELLTVIAAIYIDYSRYDQAEPLIDAAIDIARDGDKEALSIGLAWFQRAMVAFGRGDLVKTRECLDRATETLSWLSPSSDWNLHLRIQAMWAKLETLEGQPQAALDRLLPLLEQEKMHPQPGGAVQARVMAELATAYKDLGRPNEAARFLELIHPILVELDGEESQSVATNFAQRGLLDYTAGAYHSAVENLARAISMYDALSPDINGARAQSRRMLGHARFQLGDLHHGLLDFHEGLKETMAVRGIDDLHQSPADLVDKAWVEVRVLDDRDAGERDLVSAMHGDGLPVSVWLYSALLHAQVLCGDADRWRQGRELLDRVDARLQGDVPQIFQLRAEWHESHAHCRFREGRFEQALGEIDTALEVSNAPARAIERFALRTLRARTLLQLNRPGDAELELDRAVHVFSEIGASDHPHLSRVVAIRAAIQSAQANGER